MSNADEQTGLTPKKGGFGAFSQQYRDRWATGHPGKPQPADPAVPAPAPSTGEPAGTEPTQP